MTLVNAIRELMEKGITKLAVVDEPVEIEKILKNAVNCDEIALDVIKTGNGDVKGWQYHIDHADDNFIVETNGHHIIATWYESGNGVPFCVATYGDYETAEEMYADFDAWKISREAEKIADEMESDRPGELPRVVWVAIATAKLKALYAEIEALFHRDFSHDNVCNSIVRSLAV